MNRHDPHNPRMKHILKVLVGSRAHGLEREDSDYDFRGVYVLPTEDILSLPSAGRKVKHTLWLEGQTDATSWEIGHFLELATKCNPTILEVFAAPIEVANPYGLALRELFPYVWEPEKVRNAFIGYGMNQRAKFLQDKDSRPNKFMVTYLRVLFQAGRLLRDGVLLVNMRGETIYPLLCKARDGELTKGYVIDLANEMAHNVATIECQHRPDLEKVNDFLLRVRKENFNG